MIHTQNVDHLANSWKPTQVDFNFGFQVDICIALSKSSNEENMFHFNLTSHNTQNLTNQVSNNMKLHLMNLPHLLCFQLQIPKTKEFSFHLKSNTHLLLFVSHI